MTLSQNMTDVVETTASVRGYAATKELYKLVELELKLGAVDYTPLQSEAWTIDSLQRAFIAYEASGLGVARK